MRRENAEEGFLVRALEGEVARVGGSGKGEVDFAASQRLEQELCARKRSRRGKILSLECRLSGCEFVSSDRQLSPREQDVCGLGRYRSAWVGLDR